MINKLNFCFVFFLFLVNCNNSGENNSTKTNIPPIPFTFIKSYPHDTCAFTEGFLFNNGQLFESTGATENLPQTKSLFGIVDTTTGKIETKVELNKEKYFGEGITFLNGKIFQLTYKNKIGFIYNASDYKKVAEFSIPTDEGWGLTNDGKYLIMSDGTNFLNYLDPNTLKVVKTISVTENGNAKEFVNELEFIKGYIYANIWTSNKIVKINPADGKIIGELDLENLASEAKSIYPGSLEMNGIAYDSVADKLLVTGKMWPKIFEIKLK
jgi:glutamine cyclotransferase